MAHVHTAYYYVGFVILRQPNDKILKYQERKKYYFFKFVDENKHQLGNMG